MQKWGCGYQERDITEDEVLQVVERVLLQGGNVNAYFKQVLIALQGSCSAPFQESIESCNFTLKWHTACKRHKDSNGGRTSDMRTLMRCV